MTSPDFATTQAAVLELLVEITGEPDVALELNLDLFDAGLLDSLGAIELLVAIEERFDVSIAPTALERQDMNTANKIIALVQRLSA